jgi:hypothetical protein
MHVFSHPYSQYYATPGVNQAYIPTVDSPPLVPAVSSRAFHSCGEECQMPVISRSPKLKSSSQWESFRNRGQRLA